MSTIQILCLVTQMSVDFLVEVSMKDCERARIFPPLMVMPAYKQNPLSPPCKADLLGY